MRKKNMVTILLRIQNCRPFLLEMQSSNADMYVDRPCRAKHRSVLVFKEGWIPPTSLVTPSVPLQTTTIPIYWTEPQVSSGAHFLQALQYPQYIQGLNTNPRCLRQLIQLPNSDTAQRLKHVPTRHLELGFCDLLDIVPLYLQDVNDWLDQQHLEVCDV